MLDFHPSPGGRPLLDSVQSSSAVYRFGTFQVDLRTRELWKKGFRLKLQDKPFRVLSILLRHPGEIVSREQLRQELWPADTFVQFDDNLNAAIKKLRLALDDSPDNPRFVETVPRQGYRFIAPVKYEVLPLAGE